jgi:Mn2+/Fe2+ NRAMP family transporter
LWLGSTTAGRVRRALVDLLRRCEATGTPRSVSASIREAPLIHGLFTLQIAVGAGIALAPGNLVSLVVNTRVLTGTITPLILTYVLILANRKSVLGDAANGTIFQVVAAGCVAVVGSPSLLVLIETVTGLG